MGLHVVLEDQPAQGPGGVVLVGHLGEDVDQVVVEVWILVQLLESLLYFPLCCCVWTLGLLHPSLRCESEECPKKSVPKMSHERVPKNVPKVIIYLKELQDLAQAILGGHPVHPDHRDLKQ